MHCQSTVCALLVHHVLHSALLIAQYSAGARHPIGAAVLVHSQNPVKHALSKHGLCSAGIAPARVRRRRCSALVLCALHVAHCFALEQASTAHHRCITGAMHIASHETCNVQACVRWTLHNALLSPCVRELRWTWSGSSKPILMPWWQSKTVHRTMRCFALVSRSVRWRWSGSSKPIWMPMVAKQSSALHDALLCPCVQECALDPA
eukprot:scaffold101048_cov26-Tisochrysis_lutea.AAC.1